MRAKEREERVKGKRRRTAAREGRPLIRWSREGVREREERRGREGEGEKDVG